MNNVKILYRAYNLNCSYILCMKKEDKIKGLNKRHVHQIVRRLSITQVTPSKKKYSRKNKIYLKDE